MATATRLYKNRTEWQDIGAGEHTLAIDEPEKAGEGNPVSLVLDEADAIDITSTVQVAGLAPGQVAEIYFARVYKDKAGDNVVDARFRNPGQVDIMGRADGQPANASVRFADRLADHDPAYRLRVFINTPVAVRARMASRGWVVK